MSGISTHVLDTVLGKPAAGIRMTLERQQNGSWNPVGEGITDADGRCRDLTESPAPGTYRLVFATGAYLGAQGRNTIYPVIVVTFEFHGDAHFHLPLLLSDNSYTTYRGS
ncbi:hydroxyisourate hydrolase [Acidobacteria bacterium AB60]|nr:hydroxyisourate hydrolase [Acidobacteria bacterium AB60]